ncbi:hypothetical protein ABID39_001075 [Bartonella japonica]|uniref:Uncharacterized protein n=1 Tax=Bartonella japonica TaxID=357761 RepID=A0ABV2FP91_9HYPH
MSTNGHTTKQMRYGKPPFLVVEKKEKVNTSAEATMSDIAKNLCSVYAQMQMKHPFSHLKSQCFVEESFKSYLDDISRAILAEYYRGRQKEKKLFEHLEHIKALIQNLHSEKKSLEEATKTQSITRLKPLDSVEQRLAHRAGKEKQEHFSLKKVPNFSQQNGMYAVYKNTENMSQKENKSSLSTGAIKLSSKKDEKPLDDCIMHVEKHVREKRYSDLLMSGYSIENDRSSYSNIQSLEGSFLLRYPIKKFLICFLIIAFVVAYNVMLP